MKYLMLAAILVVLAMGGFAHAATSGPQAAVPGAAVNTATSDQATVQKETTAGDQDDDDWKEDAEESVQAPPAIADPLEPFNRAMYHFNDKLYFWALKPAAQGYKAVIPEEARLGVKNIFTNLGFPIRFVNCLLQAEFGGATTELGRFVINTVWGVGGLFDAASAEGINLPKQERDFGQTLGRYGIGQGIYINWPILGPSSPRDTVGFAGDFVLYPTILMNFDWTWAGVVTLSKVNDASFRIGDYEALKEAAIDPYVAMRDAYVQYRANKIKNANNKNDGGKKDLPAK